MNRIDLLPALLLLGIGGVGCGPGDTGTGPDSTPPIVRLVSPSGADSSVATPVAGAACLVVIDAVDDTGVARVVLHVDGVAVEEAGSPPWHLEWDTTVLPEASTHRLWATAVDEAGNRGVSEVAFARVFNHGPAIRIADPPDSALVLGILPVTAEFPDAFPEIEQVEFFAGEETIGTLSGPPWTVLLDTAMLPAGPSILSAQARTVFGLVGVSPGVRIFVNNGTPRASITFPASGHVVVKRGTLVLEGEVTEAGHDVTDPDRMIWRSDLDGELGRDSRLWVTDLSVGTHRITLTGSNAWGTSDSVAIDVGVKADATYEFCQDVYLGFFEHQVCPKCHSPESSQYPLHGLDLKSYVGVMIGGHTTAFRAVYPCRPESSLIVNKVTADVPWVGDSMPPGFYGQFPPINASALQKLLVWISEGAPPDVLPECHE